MHVCGCCQTGDAGGNYAIILRRPRSPAIFSLLLILYLRVISSNAQDAAAVADREILENWREYINPKMLEEYDGKDLTGRYFYENPTDAVVALSGNSDGHLQRSQFRRPAYWKNGIVPYILSEGFTIELRDHIRRSMQMLTLATLHCIKFVQRTDEKDYVNISASFGCFSKIGFVGGEQKTHLNSGCLHRFGATQHELMHILGFHHETSRQDRDNYVFVNEEQIIETQRHNFATNDIDTFQLPYDYDSIMHYPHNAFAKNKELPTLVPKKRRAEIGKDKQMSILDVAKIRLAYNCTEADLNFDKPFSNAVLDDKSRSVIGESGIPKFDSKPVTHEECLGMTSKHCRIRSFTDCYSGFFNITCNELAESEEITSFLNFVRSAKKDGPISLSLFGERTLNFSRSPEVVQVRLCEFDEATTKLLTNGTLPNLLHLQFCRSKNIEIFKGDLSMVPRLKELVLFLCTVRYIESGSFENLPSLQLFAPDYGITTENAGEFKVHLRKLHCDPTYRWLREYLELNPKLINPKEPAEVYMIGSFRSSLWNYRDIFFAVDCTKDNLLGSDRQQAFSVNDY